MSRLKFLSVSALWILVLQLVACADASDARYVFSGAVMGTQYQVQVWSNKALSEKDLEGLEKGVFNELHTVDRLMSNYKPDSDVSRINASPQKVPVDVAEQTLEVLLASKEIYTKSGGAFDVTVSPLIELWGFGVSTPIASKPDDSELERVMAHVGMDKISLDPRQRQLVKESDLQINLSAIAKGYGVDRVAQYLDSQGLSSYLVEVGGEVFARGMKPNGQPWVLGVETPDFPGRKALVTVDLKDQALATSGDYRNFIEYQGQRYSHTIDPAIGQPVKHKLASVSVLEDTCMMADGWATALMVLGDVKGLEFARRLNLNAFFIVRTATGFDTISTGSFASVMN